MKFTCDKSLLQAACNVASRAVPSKSPIASLEGLLIEVGSSIKITGYDLKKGIYTYLDADIYEQGKTVVNARFFVEMLRRLPDGILTFSCDERNGISCKCGKSEYNFIGLDDSEYPEMPKFDGLQKIEIPQNILKSMIDQTIFAVSKDEARPVYTGTLFEIENDSLCLVSVDGYRLARRTEILKNCQLENCSFIVPGFSLTDIEKICDDSDNPASISVGEKHISFNIGNTVLVTRRLDGDFLNHRKAVPENFRYVIEINRNEMISVIDRVALMLSEKNGNPVRITFEDGKIDCLCITPIGKAEDVCSCIGDGEGLEIGFNDRYMLDALKAADAETLHLCLNTSSSPCVVKAAEDEGKFTYMILPVRLHAN